jgi:hypothetical protein
MQGSAERSGVEHISEIYLSSAMARTGLRESLGLNIGLGRNDELIPKWGQGIGGIQGFGIFFRSCIFWEYRLHAVDPVDVVGHCETKESYLSGFWKEGYREEDIFGNSSIRCPWPL